MVYGLQKDSIRNKEVFSLWILTTFLTVQIANSGIVAAFNLICGIYLKGCGRQIINGAGSSNDKRNPSRFAT